MKKAIRDNLVWAYVGRRRSGKTVKLLTDLIKAFKKKRKKMVWVTPWPLKMFPEKLKTAFELLKMNPCKDFLNYFSIVHHENITRSQLLNYTDIIVIFDDMTSCDLYDTQGKFFAKMAAASGNVNNDIIFNCHGLSYLPPKVVRHLNTITIGECGEFFIDKEKIPPAFTSNHMAIYQKMKKYEFKTYEL